MSEPTKGPNPVNPEGTPQQPTLDRQPGVASEAELGGIFQDNPHEPAGATPAAPADSPAESGGAAGAPAQPVVEPEVESQPKTSLTREDIVGILAEAGLGSQPATHQAAPVPDLTPEQFEKAFNVYNPTEDLVKRLTDESPAVRIKAMTEYRDGVVRQSMTMMEYRIKQYVDTLRANDIAPLSSYVSERQAHEFRSDFYEKFPDLRPYEIIVDKVADRVLASGWTGSRDEVMQKFANDSKAVVGEMLAAGKGAPAGGNGGAAPARRMSTLSGGGQGGSSRPALVATGEAKYAGFSKNVAAGMAALDD